MKSATMMRLMNRNTALWLMAAGLVLSTSACGPKYPKCAEDGDCNEGEFCVNGMCQMCRTDSDCAAGQTCNAGRCDAIEGYCAGTEDCAADQECLNNICTAAVESSETLPPPAAPTPEESANACDLNTVFFGFDSDTLAVPERQKLQANARCLRERGVAGVRITGHADPRGTEEYNLALGDRRASAVARYLSTLGLKSEKLQSTSAGEELATGTDENTWARDRRVNFSVDDF